jgi:SAM-dependent methyltransferase
MLDQAVFKDEQRALWDSLSAGPRPWLTTFERGAAVVTQRLLELSGLRPGQSVLDVGTGLGEPALTAARVVGPAGHVLGIDLSPGMLRVARQRSAGLEHVEFRQADVESVDLPPGSFDVVVSRWGLMFVLDRVGAFRRLRDWLVPGGVLTAAVWGPPAQVPMMRLGFATLAERLALPAPPPGTPGPFSMSDPEPLAAEFTQAGFTEVSVAGFTVPFPLASAAEYVDFARASTPPTLLRAVADRYGSADDPGTWAAVRAAAETYGSGGEFTLPSATLVVRAVAPGPG